MALYIRKHILKFAIALVAACAVFVFASTAAKALWYTEDTEVVPPALEETVMEASPQEMPVRLRVPALDIDAHVQEVGVTAAGNMAAPSNFTDVGWYKYGTPPGFLGSAVVAGHVDNGLGLPGVFKDLENLRIGDEVFVERKDGSMLRFVITEIQVYPYTQVPRKTLFSRKDVPRLNLITCEGSWVAGERTYDKRLVVYTELAR